MKGSACKTWPFRRGSAGAVIREAVFGSKKSRSIRGSGLAVEHST